MLLTPLGSGHLHTGLSESTIEKQKITPLFFDFDDLFMELVQHWLDVNATWKQHLTVRSLLAHLGVKGQGWTYTATPWC